MADIMKQAKPDQTAQNNMSGSAMQGSAGTNAASKVTSALRQAGSATPQFTPQQPAPRQPAAPSSTVRTDMSTPAATTLPGSTQPAQATQLSGTQQQASNGAYQTTYVDPSGQTQTGYIINGRTYKDAGGTTEVEGGSVVTDASGRQWTKPMTPAQQTPQKPAPSTERVTDPNTPYQTTYVDSDGITRTGYIINGVTYTDAAGTTPVGTGSIVTDQSGRQWIKTATGSQLYSEYLAQQKQNQPPLTDIPPREQQSTDYAANLRNLLDEWKKAAEAGAIGQIDFATQQAIKELERALEDAQPQFKAQQDQIASDMLSAQDNAALYAEMRGDKGGIGQAQYNAIANAAAVNRQTVASQQTKLSTDTARQIADLRAQGEFEKADKLLEITQTYLGQLMSIEQWGLEFGLTVEQFNEAVRQWEAEYKLAVDQYNTSKDQWQSQFDESIRQWEADYEMGVAGLTGVFNGQLTLNGKNQISDVAAALLDAGIALSDEQLSALGMTREQADAYVASKAAATGGRGNGPGGEQPGEPAGIYQQLYAAGITDIGDAYAALIQAGYTSTEAENLSAYYTDWISRNITAPEEQRITSPDQLGTYAKVVYNAITNGTLNGNDKTDIGGKTAEDKFNDVKSYFERYYGNGKIDDKEAEYLLGMLGG